MRSISNLVRATAILALCSGLFASGTLATRAAAEAPGGAAIWTGEWFEENESVAPITGGGSFGPTPGVVTGTTTMSDSRVSGDVLAGYQWLCAPNEACTTWGTATLTNDGGTWEGDFVALNGPAPGHLQNLMMWGNGTGEYEGLSYMVNFVGPMADSIATGHILAAPLPSQVALSFPESPSE